MGAYSLLAQSNSKANSKKKKRLDKYISSATLGTGKASTHQEALDRLEDKEVRRVIDGRAARGKRKRQQLPFSQVEDSDDAEDEDELIGMDVDGEPEHAPREQEGYSRANPVVVVDSGFSTTTLLPEPLEHSGPKVTIIGGALKRHEDGSVVAPKIVKRKPKRAKSRKLSWAVPARPSEPEVGPESDDSFDSSDSAYDTHESAEDDEDSDQFEEDGNNSAKADSDASDEEEIEDSPAKEPPAQKRKRGGFKEWALKQLSSVKGYVASVEPDEPPIAPELSAEPAPPPKKKRKTESTQPGEMRGPLGEDLQLPSTSFAKHVQETALSSRETASTAKRKAVAVTRPSEVEAARLLLPIVAEEQPIMEAILLNSVVIICGETGSGKTTQVPQFLYEAGFGSLDSENPGMIGVTQPRRVAAVSMAARVAHELNLPSSRVSYQIRYDASVSPSTVIKFMTDGVLLRELATDFLLAKYSVIIIDEAHERSMNTDILIGVLSRVIKLREDMWREGKDGVKPLRLIIMSATLRVSDFAENKMLFKTAPPIISVPARQHPVTVHFSRRTPSDYVTEAVRKASKIHARLPPGGVLIFLTGQNEIAGVCRKLELRYGKKALEERRKARRSAEDIDLGNVQKEQAELAADIDRDGAAAEEDAEALDSDADSDADDELGIDKEETDVPMHIVPLYALLPSEKQMQVFRPPPSGTRLVVVSTNVAETSLTIPDIRYVVDCGRAKERRYDVANGIQAFQVSWISKASAAQRAGRAGRTGPGHCYRLYSSALYEHYFDQFSKPEILRVPIEGVVLQMKSMNIDAVINFPFPTPPDRTSLRKAETILTHLGALKVQSKGSVVLGGSITEIGKAMSLFPLSPRYSRMLVSGRQHGCLPYVIAIVSALSVGDPFLREEALVEGEEESDDDDESLPHLTTEAAKAKETRRLRRRAFFQSQQLHASLGDSISDIFRILSVVGAYEYAGGGHKFCTDHFVRPKAMEEIHKLRAQISNIVQSNFPEMDAGFVANPPPPTNLQLKVLRQLIAAGFIDQVAIRKDLVQRTGLLGEKYTTSKGVPYQALGIAEDVFIHPSSVLANTPPPDYVVFLEVVRTSRVYIKGLTTINVAWLSSLGKPLCSFSKPLKSKDGRSMVIPHFGPAGWELPPIEAKCQ
ncbi:hypothetical protein POSPLADRAFT_1066944 [Postia placenta MAD-698-R-SB12]|uniref:RNA helicase n=1 Tax=Postia placenta MAD-698-R-SB12 TaxID=670580 RepID=A0A1X6MUF4_9APHY|nr:hypothetical protein POSPLADRAFT_1066944 [Postia placenta MAD-698-R-SB12]OSX59823.1 hypothetical protein POSPLADRAFT_1066944 [Postia placenta MAD-698-R-SB12]